MKKWNYSLMQGCVPIFLKTVSFLPTSTVEQSTHIVLRIRQETMLPVRPTQDSCVVKRIDDKTATTTKSDFCAVWKSTQ